MEERNIVSVDPLLEEDEGMVCTDLECTKDAEKDISLKYPNEPDKIFHTLLCEECAFTYCKKWDMAQIFGDEVLERSDYRVS